MKDDELRGVAIALVLLFALPPILVPYYSASSQPFSELGLLGPTEQISGYPTSVAAGSNFTLYLYVGDHQGAAEYYRVYAKVGTASSVVNDNVSLAAAPIATYDMMLTSNQTYLSPVTLSLSSPGTNVRLVFELWLYETNSTSFVYDHRFTQLYLNVTSGAAA